MLIALENRRESFKAFDALHRTLERGAERKKYHCHVGFRPRRYESYDVLNFPAENLWALPMKEWKPRPADRFWCGYGVERPCDGKTLSITCEVNPPYENPSLRNGGLFAKDRGGKVYLCHTGKIGGGRKGIGKEAFWRLYRGIRGSSVLVKIGSKPNPDKAICLGRVDDRRLPMRISHFVHEVSRIKKQIVDGVGDPTAGSKSFRPEFSGRRRTYSLDTTIESCADHGIVINALANELGKAGHIPCNDEFRDMYVIDSRHDRMSILFEAKTNTSTTDVYQAIGQLMFNGRACQPEAKLIVVLPNDPTRDTNKRLRSLDIETLRYQWKNGKPLFQPRKLREILS